MQRSHWRTAAWPYEPSSPGWLRRSRWCTQTASCLLHAPPVQEIMTFNRCAPCLLTLYTMLSLVNRKSLQPQPGFVKSVPPNLCDWKIGMILLKNRKEIAFPIGVCSKIIKKNRKILSKHELGMVKIQILSSKFRMVGTWEVCWIIVSSQ